MTELGFLHGNGEELKDKTSRVTLIEPVVESVIQLFFQFLIVLIIFGPNLDKGDHIYLIVNGCMDLVSLCNESVRNTRLT